MEYDKIFITAAVIIISVMAFFGVNGLVTSLNDDYGSTVGSDTKFATGVDHIQDNLQESFNTIGDDVGTGVEGEEGAGSTDTNTNLATRGLNIISAIKGLTGLFPSLLSDASTALGLGGEYTVIATSLFIILFGIAFAYLLFLGVNK